MALLTLSDIQTAVKARGFGDDQDTRIVQMANDVCREIVGDHHYRFMLATATVAAVAGTHTYNLPTAPALMHVDSVRLADGSGTYPELEHIGDEELLDLQNLDPASVNQTGPAVWSSLATTTFTVYPTPAVAGTFTVRYFKAVVDMVAAGDTPNIPAAYLDAVVEGVCELLALRERQFNTAEAFRARMERRVRAMKRQYGIRQRQSGTQVRESGRYDSLYGSPDY